jgi:hypothetical protein
VNGGVFRQKNGQAREMAMSKRQLEKQANRADAIADQTVDKEVVKTLRDAAKAYRDEAANEEPSEQGGTRAKR